MPEKEVIKFDQERSLWHIFPEYCKGCGLCKEKCPNQVLIWSDKLGVYGTPTVRPKDEDSCIGCGICQMVCPDCAISVIRKRKKKAV